MTPGERTDDLIRRGYVNFYAWTAVTRAIAEAIADERKRLTDLIDRRAEYLRSINATGSKEEWRSSDWRQGLEEAVDIIDGVFSGQFAPLTDDDDIALQYG